MIEGDNTDVTVCILYIEEESYEDKKNTHAIYTKMLNLVSYDILCHCGNFSNDISYELFYKYCHPNLLLVRPL